MKAIFCLALFFAAVFAQPYTDLNNATTVTTLQVATPGSDSAAERIQTVYRVWVPENTLQVVVEAGCTVGGCSDPEVMVGMRGPTCHYAGGDWNYGIVPCEDYYETTSNRTYDTTSYNSAYDMRYGAYWYVGVRKYTGGFDRDLDCTFALTVTVVTCPAGQVSLGNTPTCVTPIAINASTTYTLANVTSAEEAVVYTVTFTQEISRIEVLIYTDDTSLESAGWPQLATEYTYSYACYAAESSGLVNLTCYGIRPGKYFIGLTTSSSTSGSGNITVNTIICPTNFTGLTCTDPMFPYTFGLVGGIVPAVGSNPFYTQHVYYIDFVANTSSTFNLTVSGSTGYLVYRKDVFPYYQSPSSAEGSYGYYNFDSTFSLTSSPSVFFTPHDTYNGGRHYIAIVNYDSTNALNYTFAVSQGSTTGATNTGVATTAAATGVATTSAAATTGVATTSAAATTGVAATTAAAATTAKVTTGAAAATTGGKSAASSVVASVFLVLAMIAALL